MIDFARDNKRISKLREIMKTLIEKPYDKKKWFEALDKCCEKLFKNDCSYEINISDKELLIILRRGVFRYQMKETFEVEEVIEEEVSC